MRLGGGGTRTPLIPALGRQKQVDFCKFESSLVYRASSRTGSKATKKPCLEQTKKKKKLSNYKIGFLFHSSEYQKNASVGKK